MFLKPFNFDMTPTHFVWIHHSKFQALSLRAFWGEIPIQSPPFKVTSAELSTYIASTVHHYTIYTMDLADAGKINLIY